ncbi:rab GTPase activator [Ascodesmis nigricans]|uniref:Rab GTPase activator n=1 Tax=Ascodesmis nigricans TaxID=341454 RepID=A0A4S2N0W0_9PEZI|nr:rab GTPase activator [Ascodesmis nigricans]
MGDLNEEYDIVVVGTGLTECILSGVFGSEGKKVLNIDANSYYGGESASLNMFDMWKKFRWSEDQRRQEDQRKKDIETMENEEREAEEKRRAAAKEAGDDSYKPLPKGERPPQAGPNPPEHYGKDMRSWNQWHISLIPKFLMADGELTRILHQTGVTNYIELLSVGGSFVVKKGVPSRVPSTRMEAVKSPLVSTMQKYYMQNFLQFIANYKEEDASTHKSDLNLDKNTMREAYKIFGLDSWTSEFIGHAMALYSDDSYLDRPAREPIERIILYVKSMARFGNSPYIFPIYGLGELPERFSFLSAVYGGTYALNTPLQEILYDDSGRVSGVKFPHPITKEETVIKTKKVIADPTYFLGDSKRIRATGKLVRAICILDHPVEGTDNVESAQIIIPASQTGRKHDIYISVLSSVFNVCPKGFYLASVSTVLEDPEGGNPHQELEAGFERLGLGSGRLGEKEEKFISVVDIYEPVEDGTRDNVFISRSYDAATHFESTTDDVKDIYKRVEGKDLVIKERKEQPEEQ